MDQHTATTGQPTGKRPWLVLASRSPRRRLLLTEHGLPHEAYHPGFEDGGLRRGEVTPEQWVAALASLKAWAGAMSPASCGQLVLGADTACLMDGQLIGTPADSGEAEAMLRGFIGREHDVLTGVAMIDQRRSRSQAERHIFVDRATVRFGQLSESDIADYIRGGDWVGKAGAYNLRDRLNAGWPIEYSGDVTTIMGLPMKALLNRLAKLGLAGRGMSGGAIEPTSAGAVA